MGICIIMQNRFTHSRPCSVYSNVNTVSRHLIRTRKWNALNSLKIRKSWCCCWYESWCVEYTRSFERIIFVTNSPFVITALKLIHNYVIYIAVIVHLMREWLHTTYSLCERVRVYLSNFWSFRLCVIKFGVHQAVTAQQALFFLALHTRSSHSVYWINWQTESKCTHVAHTHDQFN